MNDEERRKKRIAIDEKALEELRTHMETEDQQKRRALRWHVGREVPIAVIGTIILQTIGVIWGAATLAARVDYIEKTEATAHLVQATVDKRQDDEARRSEDRVIVQLDKINAKIDRVLEGKGRAYQ